MKLYGYYRSSASYRARIALNLKGLKYDYVSVNLLKDETLSEEYRRINPQAIVPALEDDGVQGGVIVPQSMAICEYLEERFPTPPILPRDPAGRSRVRAIALNIACEIHPLANRRTQVYLGEQLKVGENELGEWSRHWIGLNFAAIEQMLKDSRATGRFCHGDAPDDGGRFPGAADFQRRASQTRHGALSDDPPNQRGMPEARGVRRRASRAAARRGQGVAAATRQEISVCSSRATDEDRRKRQDAADW
jgi:maleylacetoacetate isomerase